MYVGLVVRSVILERQTTPMQRAAFVYLIISAVLLSAHHYPTNSNGLSALY